MVERTAVLSLWARLFSGQSARTSLQTLVAQSSHARNNLMRAFERPGLRTPTAGVLPRCAPRLLAGCEPAGRDRPATAAGHAGRLPEADDATRPVRRGHAENPASGSQPGSAPCGWRWGRDPHARHGCCAVDLLDAGDGGRGGDRQGQVARAGRPSRRPGDRVPAGWLVRGAGPGSPEGRECPVPAGGRTAAAVGRTG